MTDSGTKSPQHWTSNKVHFFKSLKDLQSKPVLVCSGSNVSIYHINTFCHIPIIWNFNMALKIFSHIIKHSSCRKEKTFSINKGFASTGSFNERIKKENFRVGNCHYLCVRVQQKTMCILSQDILQLNKTEYKFQFQRLDPEDQEMLILP